MTAVELDGGPKDGKVIDTVAVTKVLMAEHGADLHVYLLTPEVRDGRPVYAWARVFKNCLAHPSTGSAA